MTFAAKIVYPRKSSKLALMIEHTDILIELIVKNKAQAAAPSCKGLVVNFKVSNNERLIPKVIR